MQGFTEAWEAKTNLLMQRQEEITAKMRIKTNKTAKLESHKYSGTLFN